MHESTFIKICWGWGIHKKVYRVTSAIRGHVLFAGPCLGVWEEFHEYRFCPGFTKILALVKMSYFARNHD